MTAAPVLQLAYSSTESAPQTVFAFDGTAAMSHVFAGTAADAFPAGAFSVACWLKTNAGTGPLFAYTAAGGSAPLLTLADPGALSIGFAGQARLATGLSIADGEWHQIVLTLVPLDRTLARATLYIDGLARVTGTLARAGGAWPAATGTVTLGNIAGGTLQAQASEFQIWAGALNALQVATGFRRRAAAADPGIALVWALRDAASSGTVTGGGANPFVASTLTFRQVPTGQPDFATVAWAAATGATGYGVEVWSLDGSWHWSASPSSEALLGVTGLLLGRPYRGRVRSVDAGGPGPWSGWAALTPLDLAATVPQFSWLAVAQPLTASWNEPDQAQGFLLDVARDPAPSPVPPPQTTTATSVDLSTQFASGDYGWTVSVEAEAAGSLGPAAPAEATTAPVFSFYYVDDGAGTGGSGSFEFDWTALPPGLELAYFLVTKGGTTVLQQVIPAAGCTSPQSFPSPIAVATGDQLTGVMRTLGAGAISHPGSQTVTAHDVARPQLTWTTATTAPEAVSERWAAVPDAGGYNVSLYQDAAATPIVTRSNAADLSFDFTPYLAAAGATALHSYRLKVQAVSQGEIGPPNQIAAPPAAAGGIRYDWNGTAGDPGVLKVAWTPGPAASFQ